MGHKPPSNKTREKIIELVAQGKKNNREIAEEVGVSYSTIGYTLKRAKEKSAAKGSASAQSMFVEYAPVLDQKIEIEYGGIKFRIAGSDRDGLRNLIALIKDHKEK